MSNDGQVLTIGLASSALFDLSESDRVFREQGKEAYAEYQRTHEHDVLAPGIALPFVRRLLKLNALPAFKTAPVEVVLLSRNDPNTGMRVMNSVEAHGLTIAQASFLQGESPTHYIESLGVDLFLSANEEDVRRVLEQGFAAGQCLASNVGEDGADGGDEKDTDDDEELRLAFDFDGVLADDESESVYQRAKNLDEFNAHELARSDVAHNPGPLKSFIDKVHAIQKLESDYALAHDAYQPRLKIAIVTARSAPAHKRVINTMRSWNIHPNQAFFMGGKDKTLVLANYKPHMFFDDQRKHLEGSAAVAPAVHVPFGALNNE